jgi:hypothetical protein
MKSDLAVDAPALQGTPQGTLKNPLLERRGFYPWDILLPAAIVFWALGVSRVKTTHLGPYGLPAVLPIVFYVGIGLVVISTGWALAMARPSPVRLSAHLGVFLMMLYGTAPLVYSQARYSWLYKYIGVVQYINLHGRVNQRIDIFQNWPGFFALIAWFDRVAGIQSPLAYAKWAQLIFEVLTCIMLYFAFRALELTVRERWLALFLYAGSIWIAQDYLSAQALGTVLSAGIFALALNYLSRTDEAKWLTWTRIRLQPVSRFLRHSKDSTARTGPQVDESALLAVTRGSSGHDGAIVAALSLLYFVLVFEHELSPYVVLIQLGCLAAIGRIRHRWLLVLLMLIVVGYFAPRFTFVNSQFGILQSLGSFFSNAAPPLVSLGKLKVSSGITFSAHAARILTLVMWALAAVGAWRRWRDGRPTLALVLLAYSPALVFFAGAYGNEGLLRVFLFSLPWTACLVASAIKPVAGGMTRWGAFRAPLALAIVVALFFPAFFGDDAVYVMSKAEVQGVSAFYQSASPGTIFVPDGNFPGDINGRYNQFPTVGLYGPGGILTPVNPANPAPTTAAAITNVMRGEEKKLVKQEHLSPQLLEQPIYLILSNGMQTYGTAYGLFSPDKVQKLTNAFDQPGTGWIRILQNQDVTIFELAP